MPRFTVNTPCGLSREDPLAHRIVAVIDAIGADLLEVPEENIRVLRHPDSLTGKFAPDAVVDITVFGDTSRDVLQAAADTLAAILTRLTGRNVEVRGDVMDGVLSQPLEIPRSAFGLETDIEVLLEKADDAINATLR